MGRVLPPLGPMRAVCWAPTLGCIELPRSLWFGATRRFWARPLGLGPEFNVDNIFNLESLVYEICSNMEVMPR